MAVDSSVEVAVELRVGVLECGRGRAVTSVVNVGRWMGWVECEDDGDVWLESCVAWFCDRLGRRTLTVLMPPVCQ